MTKEPISSKRIPAVCNGFRADAVQVIAFDADDTLWHNETIFEASHRRFAEILAHYHDPDTVEKALTGTELANLPIYGYGIKGFALSALETALQLTGHKLKAEEVAEILELAKTMLGEPVELLPGVVQTLTVLKPKYRLYCLTKGDLRDQERKMASSGLEPFFLGVEIVSEKDGTAYRKFLQKLDMDPSSFLMVGNSPKSDILPVIEIGGQAAYVPYPLTWHHEQLPGRKWDGQAVLELESISDLPPLLGI